MSDEQLYRFVDNNGECFEAFQKLGEDDCDKIYHDTVGAMLRVSNDGERSFSVGDMLCFRDELQDAGFEWGKDFYVIKVKR